MINRVILVGRITKDLELKSTQSNISFCNFTLAVNRPFTEKDGSRQADFIQVVVWRKQAEDLVKYQNKGSLIGVDGRIQTRSYEVDGNMRYVTEVVADSIAYLESKREQEDDFHETSKQLATEESLPF